MKAERRRNSCVRISEHLDTLNRCQLLGVKRTLCGGYERFKLLLDASFGAAADGVPRDCEKALANVHADDVAALEGVPKIGLDVDPVGTCRRGVGIDLDLIPNRAAFWST